MPQMQGQAVIYQADANGTYPEVSIGSNRYLTIIGDSDSWDGASVTIQVSSGWSIDTLSDVVGIDFTVPIDPTTGTVLGIDPTVPIDPTTGTLIGIGSSQSISGWVNLQDAFTANFIITNVVLTPGMLMRAIVAGYGSTTSPINVIVG